MGECRELNSLDPLVEPEVQNISYIERDRRDKEIIILLILFLLPRIPSSLNVFCQNIHEYLQGFLTHFSPMSHFYTPWKRQKINVFLAFSGGIGMWHWTKKGYMVFSNKQSKFRKQAGTCLWKKPVQLKVCFFFSLLFLFYFQYKHKISTKR